jgi:hypothetical protein
MVNLTSARRLADMIRREPGASWFWVVGAGVSAAVSQAREATWIGLVVTAVEHVNARQIDNWLLAKVGEDLAAWGKKPFNFWQVIDALEESLDGPEACKRFLYQRLSQLELRDATLLDRLAAFSWPLATTNFDDLLSVHGGRGEPLLAHELGSHDVRDWLRKATPRVLHLHGHVHRPDGLLFTKSDYARYCHLDSFRRTQNEIFTGRPVFVGCGGALTDPNIQWTLADRARRGSSYAAEPIVLVRDGEKLDLKIPVEPVGYGEHYADLAPFLAEVMSALEGRPSRRPAAVSEVGSDHSWTRVYCARVAGEFKELRLPDFRAGDRDVPIPLDDVYVALVLDHRDSQERLEEARLAHYQSASVQDAIARDPMPRRVPVQRSPGTAVLLDDVLRDDPVAVLLGDPGTGKTTLVHWLARQAALARLDDRRDIVVEALRIDAEASSPEPRRIGPAWLPIVVPMRQYAIERSELQVAQPRRVLRFLAHHVAARLAEDGRTMSPEAVEASLEALAAGGQLLVALDGLDEIPQIQRREDIVAETEQFLRWLFGVTVDGGFVIAAERATNRLLITSRLAGYKHAPLSVNVPHYQVQPMRPASVRRLIHNLFLAVRRATGQPDGGGGPPLAELETGLLEALGDPTRQLGSLSATPVLASAIFALHVGNDGLLPRDRRHIYAKIVDLFVVREARRLGATGDEVVATAAELRRMFQRLAFEAFRAPDNTLIPEAQLIARLRELGAASRPAASSPLPEHGVGLLVPLAPGAYGFIHRTFQEYLCAEHLTQPGQPFDELVRLAGFATWREPARLGFMIWAMQPASSTTVASEVENLIRGSRMTNGLRPISLAVAAVAEANGPTRELLGVLAGGAITALAATRGTLENPPRDLVAALAAFARRQDGAIAIEQALETALSRLHEASSPLEVAAAAVSADLMTALDVHPPHLVRALLDAEPADPETLGWPITRTLLRLVTPRLETLRPLKTAEMCELDRTYVPRVLSRIEASEATLHFQLHPEQMERVRSDPAWARLLAVLLGGERDYDLKTHRERYDRLQSFLQMEDSRHDELRGWIPVSWRLLLDERALAEDFIFGFAVYLDRIGATANRASKIAPRMNPATFFLREPRWRAVVDLLAGSAEAASRGDPLLEVTVRPVRHALSDEDRVRARKVQRRLDDAARRGLSCIDASSAGRAMAQLAGDARQAMFIDSLCAVAARFGVTDFIEKFSVSGLGPRASRIVRREQGARAFHLFSGDRSYSVAVWAGIRAKDDYELLVDIARAHLLWTGDESYMPRLPFPYTSAELRHQIVDYLSIIDQCPKLLAYFLVDNLTHLRRSSPALFDEIACEARATISRIEVRDGDGLVREELDSAEACWARLVASAPTPWALRGRIRLLSVLDEGTRIAEEHALLAAANALPDGLPKAQTLELLARHAECLPIDELLDAALAVDGLGAGDAAALRIRLLALAPEDLRARIFAQALARTRGAEIDDRISLLRGLAEHAAWAGQVLDAAPSLAEVEDPITAAYIEGRYGDVLAGLVDGPLRDDPYFGAEAFAPLIAHARLDDATTDVVEAHASSHGIAKLRTAQRALDGGDLLRILDAFTQLSMNSPPGLLALWRRSRDRITDPQTWEQMDAVLSAAATGLSPRNVGGLLSALSAGHDGLRGRARALLVPHGHGMHAGTPSASAQGLPLLLELGKHRDHQRQRRSIAVQITWRLETIELDDPDMARGLLDAADAGSIPARSALDALSYATPAVIAYLADRFPTARPSTQRSLLGLFSRHVFRCSKRSKKPAIEPPPSLAIPAAVDAAWNRPLLVLEPEALVRSLIETPGEPVASVQHLREASGLRIFDVFAQGDSAQAVHAIGRRFFTRRGSSEEKDEAYAAAAEAVLATTGGVPRIAEVVFDLLRDSMDDDPPEWLRYHLLVSLAAAAERKPATVSAVLQPVERRGLLAEAAGHVNSFTGRRAAFLVMGCVFATPHVQPLPDEIDALTRAAFDVPEVIDAALTAARQVRSLSPRSLQRMLSALHGDSAARAALAGRILVSIAGSSEVGQAVREEIMDALNRFVEDPRSARTAHFGRLDIFSPPAMTIREMLINEFEAGGEGVRIAAG